MSADLYSGKPRNRGPEKQTVADRRRSGHGILCRSITGLRCLMIGKCNGKTSTANRRKLAVLIYNLQYGIGENRTLYTIHDNIAHRDLTDIWLVAGFTIDDRG